MEKNYLEIFIDRKSGDNRQDREILGRVPAESGEYEIEGLRRVRVDLSNVNSSLRGPKVVVVEVDGMGYKEISLSRKMARGYQTVGPGVRIGVAAYNPVGLTRRS